MRYRIVHRILIVDMMQRVSTNHELSVERLFVHTKNGSELGARSSERPDLACLHVPLYMNSTGNMISTMNRSYMAQKVKSPSPLPFMFPNPLFTNTHAKSISLVRLL